MSAPRRLRAPQEHAAVVADPPLDLAPALLSGNRQLIRSWQGQILGRSWPELRKQASREILDLSGSYSTETHPSRTVNGAASVIMAGHQPELFHPGVWVKNFALARLAASERAYAVNLVVDNDTVKTTTLRFPVLEKGNPGHARLAAVPFDQWEGELPYEIREVRNEEMFRRLPEEVARHTDNWGFTPFLEVFWKEVLLQAKRTPLLGERLAAARRSFERRWGCNNLEAPVSLLCLTEAFAWFVSHLLLNFRRFHCAHNECLREHRRSHGIRSRNHPVPDLAAEEDWRELPLWSWRAGQNRRRLFSRTTAQDIELRSGQEAWPSLRLPPPGREIELVRAWQDLEKRGFKVRSRALTNTLFARWYAADLFIHGMGGAKYDELTDDIARRFYDVEPPKYLVLSATLLLPLPTFPALRGDGRHWRRQVRDLHYNPQRYLPPEIASNAEVQRLLAKKSDWIGRHPASARARRERFEMIRSLTGQLRPLVQDQSERLRREIERHEGELEANSILRRRDYAFCFYPEAMLREFCSRFLE